MSVDERVRELEQLRDRVAGVMNLPAGTTDDQVVAAAFNAYGAAHPEGPGSDVRAELERLRGALERAEDALAEADQTQQRSDDQRGDTRDGVMQAIVEAGLAGYVCDDDDLPDMVRHALTAAKKLAQPALWTYNDHEAVTDLIGSLFEAANNLLTARSQGTADLGSFFDDLQATVDDLTRAHQVGAA